MSKHTPGPWALSDDIPPCVYSVESQDCIAATDAGSPYACIEDVAEATANARLIAQAPRLLEALENLLSRLSNDADGKNWFPEEQQEARAAIKAAKGEGND